MKKFIFILVLQILILSCNPHIVNYEKINSSNIDKYFLISSDHFSSGLKYTHKNFGKSNTRPIGFTGKPYELSIIKSNKIFSRFILNIKQNHSYDFEVDSFLIVINESDSLKYQPEKCEHNVGKINDITVHSEICFFNEIQSYEIIQEINNNYYGNIEIIVLSKSRENKIYELSKIDKIAFKNSIELYELLSKYN